MRRAGGGHHARATLRDCRLQVPAARDRRGSPSAAWPAFQFSAVRRPRLPRDLAHLAGPVLVAAASLATPALLEALIPALFLGYGGAILLAAWRGADALPRLPFEAGDTPGLV